MYRELLEDKNDRLKMDWPCMGRGEDVIKHVCELNSIAPEPPAYRGTFSCIARLGRRSRVQDPLPANTEEVKTPAR